jgi:hypothetical protein
MVLIVLVVPSLEKNCKKHGLHLLTSGRWNLLAAKQLNKNVVTILHLGNGHDARTYRNTNLSLRATLLPPQEDTMGCAMLPVDL